MAQPTPDILTVGNYRLYDVIGRGGMGTVHLGRLFGTGGFRRLVAIKRLHPHLAEDVEFVSAFLDEARLASRIHHPNVVAPLDVIAADGEVFLVLEYVPGLSLSKVRRLAAASNVSIPARIITAIMVDVLSGLQAAHEATSDEGEPLDLIHRDVSPENILVGKDGSARLLDFGVAKASGRAQSTTDGVVKGKRGYMAPEHLRGRSCRESDLYSSAVVLFELLTERRLFLDDETLSGRLSGVAIEWPEDSREIDASLRSAVLHGLAYDPKQRFASAREMSQALEGAGLASAREVGDWLESIADAELREREARVAHVEALRQNDSGPSPPRLTDAAHVGSSTISHESPADPRHSRFARLSLAVAIIVLGLLVVGAFVFRGRSEPGLVLKAGLHDLFPHGSFADSSPATSKTVAAVEPKASASSGLPKAKGGPPTSRTHLTKPPCKPYVLDKDGRTRFNEACLR